MEANDQNLEEEEDWEIESDAETVEIINQRLTSLDPFQKCKNLKVKKKLQCSKEIEKLY